MNKKLFDYYNKELENFRNLGLEFANQYPKVAGRLNIKNLDLIDPYVERLIEGVSYLTARTQLKIDTEYPNFVTKIFEVVYPQFLTPTPACCIANVNVSDYNMNVLNHFKRNQKINSFKIESLNIPTHCEFTATQDLALSPLQIESVNYEKTVNWLPYQYNHNDDTKYYSGIRIDFSIKTAGAVSALIPDLLKIHLGNDINKSSNLLHLMMNCCEKVLIHSFEDPKLWQQTINAKPIQCGFKDSEALVFNLNKNLPFLRHVQEFIQLPEKFCFLELPEFANAVKKAENSGFISKKAEQIEEVVNENGVNKKIVGYNKRYFSLSFIFNKHANILSHLKKQDISIHALPFVNLFQKKGIRFHVDDLYNDIHVVADKTQPTNFEIHTVNKVTGYDIYNNKKIDFRPVYKVHSQSTNNTLTDYSFFGINRKPRVLTEKKQLKSMDSNYESTELYINLVNNNKVVNEDINQLSIESWCTNRDLAHYIPRNEKSDFLIESAMPVKGISIFSEFKRARPAIVEDGALWNMLNLLNFNLLSFANNDKNNVTLHLKELLYSFPHKENDIFLQFVNGIVDVNVSFAKRLIKDKTSSASGLVRGTAILITFDEAELSGMHPFIFCSVLAKFFSQSATVNSFVQLSMKTLQNSNVIHINSEDGSRSLV